MDRRRRFHPAPEEARQRRLEGCATGRMPARLPSPHGSRTSSSSVIVGGLACQADLPLRRSRVAFWPIINMSTELPLPARGMNTRLMLRGPGASRSEEHTSELQSLMRSSYAVFCLKKKKNHTQANI